MDKHASNPTPQIDAPPQGMSFLGSAIAFGGALVTGAAVGAGLALLYAPELGKDLRARLALGYERMTGESKSKPEIHASGVAPHDGKHDGKHDAKTDHVATPTDGHTHPRVSHT